LSPLNVVAEAVSFNFNLCARVNITIPNFLGCAVTSVSGGVTAVSITQGSTSAGSTFAGSTPAGSTFAGTSPTYTPTPVTIPSAASVVNYDGRSLLTGTCTSAQFAAATLVGGTILKYPWLGCASANPGCCPFSVAQPGPLNSCPVDYFTTSGACCPTYITTLSALFIARLLTCMLGAGPFIRPIYMALRHLATRYQQSLW